MSLRIFKFGGASVRDADNIRNLLRILERYKNDKIVLVVSAMGKTTNALEEVVKEYLESGAEKSRSLLNEIIEGHLNTAAELGLSSEDYKSDLDALVQSAFTAITQAEKKSKSAVYDQIVSLGELFSTKLVARFLQSNLNKVVWQDVRELIYTDNTYREGVVNFKKTQDNVDSVLKVLSDKNRIVITQGFLGRSREGLTVTLGREGSDFTAAILAFCMDVEDVYIWKDVPGVLTADPRKFQNVEKIDRMSYKEAIEMTYYGAQVIHPKTIRPLQNKGIRLHVKSFIHPDSEGTIISMDGLLNYPPIVVIQEDVILMQISSRDFSFIAENHLSQIFTLMNKYRIKLCSMRNSAISFTICIKNPGSEEFEKLLKELDKDFLMDIFQNLQLYTLRYANENLIENLTKNKVVLFEERMKYTIQIAVRPALELIEKA